MGEQSRQEYWRSGGCGSGGGRLNCSVEVPSGWRAERQQFYLPFNSAVFQLRKE
jgi:hypothetical protein